jgi:hypothetical protein
VTDPPHAEVMTIRYSTTVGVALVVACWLAGCSTSTAREVDTDEEGIVSEIIVRYSPDAPGLNDEGQPWGSQCVSPSLRDQLHPDRDIGGRMKVIRIQPSASVLVAQDMARQIEQCPFIEWAEADTVRLDYS